MPELIQDAFTPQRLADQLQRYLTDADARAQTLATLDETNALLGTGDASTRAADAIVSAVAGQ
jgi:lipid A disaccharide synthetase